MILILALCHQIGWEFEGGQKHYPLACKLCHDCHSLVVPVTTVNFNIELYKQTC